MKHRLFTLPAFILCASATLMISSCNNSSSDSSGITSISEEENLTADYETLSYLSGVVLTDTTGATPDEGEAIITEAKFVCARYVWYTVQYKPVGSSTVESFYSGTSTYEYNSSTGMVTITMMYNSTSRGTISMTIYNQDTSTVSIQSGGTMILDDEQYTIINTQMTKSAYES